MAVTLGISARIAANGRLVIMSNATPSLLQASWTTSVRRKKTTAPATRSNSATNGCIAASVIVSRTRAIACVAFLHLRKRTKHPNLRACSTDRKEVIRCRVISFSRTWPQRIALSGSSLPFKARDARLVTFGSQPEAAPWTETRKAVSRKGSGLFLCPRSWFGSKPSF